MILKVGTYEYGIQNASQQISSAGCQFSMTFADSTLDAETIDNQIRPIVADGFEIGGTEYYGYNLISVSKEIYAEETVLAMRLFKERTPND